MDLIDAVRNPNYTIVGLLMIILGAALENTTLRPNDKGPYVLMASGFVILLGIAISWYVDGMRREKSS